MLLMLSPGCMVVYKEPGWPGALQQLPGQTKSCAMAGDMCWGMNPALDLPLPKEAEGVERPGK